VPRKRNKNHVKYDGMMSRLVQISPFTITDAMEKLGAGWYEVYSCIKYYYEFFSKEYITAQKRGRPYVKYTYIGGWNATETKPERV